MSDLHRHPMVKPDDPSQLLEYLRSDSYAWGYEAVRHGGFTAVGTANVYRGMLNTDEMSFIQFEDLLDEIGMMLSDVGHHDEVVKVSNAGLHAWGILISYSSSGGRSSPTYSTDWA